MPSVRRIAMQDKTDSFYTDMQRYIAVTTVGPSALRNQGGPGVIETAQRFLAALDMRIFTVHDEKTYLVKSFFRCKNSYGVGHRC